MTRPLYFLVVPLGLFATAACFYDLELDLYLDDRYSKTIKAVFNVLWKSVETKHQYDTNVLIFTIPSATEVNFIYQMLDEDMKKTFAKSIPLYDLFQDDLRKAEDKLLPSREIHLKTIFYGNLEEMNKRMMFDHDFFSNLHVHVSESKDRFQLILYNAENRLAKWSELSSAVKESGIAVSCGVRHCAYPVIFNKNAPLSILTLATWNITSVKALTWTEEATFTGPETSTRVKVARGLNNFFYAEFRYPNLIDCVGRVLRLPYTWNLNLAFVLPSDDKMCGSGEGLWRDMSLVDLNRLRYRKLSMLVSIPLFSVSAEIDLRMKLKETALADAFDQPSSRLYKVLALQAAEVIFNPQIPTNFQRPFVSENTPRFVAERPFFLALFHRTSRTPIFAGLINNPDCVNECHEPFLLT